MPQAARAYLGRLEELIGTEVALIGVGPDRVQSIVRPDTWLTRQIPGLL